MASFNIFGSCVCRDVFGFNEQSEHDINRFMQASSPVCCFYLNEKPIKLLSYEDFDTSYQMNNFKKKCIIHDYNNSVLDQYKEKANYFLLDLVDIFNNDLVCEYTENNKRHYFTNSSWFVQAYSVDKKLNREINYEVINVDSFVSDQCLYEVIRRYIEWLEKDCGYLENEIIILENHKVSNYVDNNKLADLKK